MCLGIAKDDNDLSIWVPGVYDWRVRAMQAFCMLLRSQLNQTDNVIHLGLLKELRGLRTEIEWVSRSIFTILYVELVAISTRSITIRPLITT